MNTGQNIAKIRISKGWTQRRLARAAGLSKSFISALEEGRERPRVRTLAIIAKCLEVEIEKIYQDD